jgi:hypothetical protein
MLELKTSWRFSLTASVVLNDHDWLRLLQHRNLRSHLGTCFLDWFGFLDGVADRYRYDPYPGVIGDFSCSKRTINTIQANIGGLVACVHSTTFHKRLTW